MENNADIKRGVDFEARAGKGSLSLRQVFGWWNGGRFSRKTLLFLSIVWVMNLIIILPIFGRDLTMSYSSSAFLVLISDFLKRFLHVPQHYFFSVLTFFCFTFAPVSFYLFVRKMAMRHEVTALIATIFFILPNPFLANAPILVAAVLKGEGAHVFTIVYVPFFLLYVQSFISTGAPSLYFLTAIGISTIAIISPFSLLNFLIFFGVLLIAEGFQGNLRIKLIRSVMLLFTAGALSFYWYYPSIILKFASLSYVQSAFAKFLGILPAAIPIIPVAGALSFLIFDRREKLKPIFVSLSLFLIYLTFYLVSNQLDVGSIFSADRYLPELILSVSFFLAIIVIFITGFIFRQLTSKLEGSLAFFGTVVLITFVVALVGFLAFQGVGIVHNYIESEKIVESYSAGVTSNRGLVDLHDITSIFATIVSTATFIFLIFILRKYPSYLERKV